MFFYRTARLPKGYAKTIVSPPQRSKLCDERQFITHRSICRIKKKIFRLPSFYLTKKACHIMYELIQRIIYRWFHFDKRIVSLRSRSLLINSRQSTVIFIFFFFCRRGEYCSVWWIRNEYSTGCEKNFSMIENSWTVLHRFGEKDKFLMGTACPNTYSTDYYSDNSNRCSH